MEVKLVDLGKQYQSIKQEIDDAIQHCLNNSTFIGGEAVKSFEAQFANYVGVDHCVGVANGTDAIEIALQALGIGKGDEVIVPAHSWISTAEAVSFVGAAPVFVDTIPGVYTIDPSAIAAKISSNTKCIIPVHLYGHPAQMDDIMSVAKKNNLKVIEDCAQAHGAQFNGQNVGSFGELATFSFYPGKNLGAYGDAGCIVTDTEELATKCRMFANHGQLKKNHHEMEGRNSRLDTLQASILSVKLKYLPDWTNSRTQHAANYREKIDHRTILTPTVQRDCKHVYHLFVIQTNEREALMTELKANGIQCAIHYPSMLPFLKPYGDSTNTFPVSAAYQNTILSLPMFPELTEAEIDYICNIINKHGK